MEWQQALDTLAALPPEDKAQWLRIGAGVAALMLLLLWLESRFFARSGRAGSWLAGRLVSAIVTPLVLSVHSVVSFDFAMALSQTSPDVGIVFLTNLPDSRFVNVDPKTLPKRVAYLRKSQLVD